MIYDELVSGLAARGNSYASYLQAGRPPQHWQAQMPSGLSGGTMIDIGGIPRTTMPPLMPVTQQPVAGPQPAAQPVITGPQQLVQPTAPPVGQAAPAALADQLISSGQQPVWQQVSDRSPDNPSGLVFQRTSRQPEGVVEVVAPAPPVQPMATDEDGLVATQPMVAATPPPRRPLGDGPMAQGWGAARQPQPAPAQDYTHLPPRPPMNADTLAPSTGVQSPLEQGAAVWGNVAEQG